MTPNNIILKLLMGSITSVPRNPMPKEMIEALESIKIKHSDEEQSGFEIVFDAGRSRPSDMHDLSLFSDLKPFEKRIQISVSIAFTDRFNVLMDGIITKIEYAPSTTCSSSLIVTGEDLSIMMDLDEINREYLNHQPENIVAKEIIGRYTQFGLKDDVRELPSGNNSPQTANQRGTDLKYLKEIAARFNYDFYIIPGTTAYWGPPERTAKNEKPFLVNMEQKTNIDSIRFEYNSLSAKHLRGYAIDKRTNKCMLIDTSNSKQQSPLVSEPALNAKSKVRTELIRSSCPNVMQAQSYAQGMTEDSASKTATATGTLDSLKYGDILMPRKIVELQGAGWGNDCEWYVKEVTHNIKRGEYKQSFILTRDGWGSKCKNRGGN